MTLFFTILASLVCSFTTHFLSTNYQQGPVRSSSLVSLFYGLLLMIGNHFIEFNIDFWLKVIFGASFIGMCSVSWNHFKIFLSTIVYSLTLFSFFPLLPYPGGALGFCAFLAMLIIYFLFHFLPSKKKTFC